MKEKALRKEQFLKKSYNYPPHPLTNQSLVNEKELGVTSPYYARGSGEQRSAADPARNSISITDRGDALLMAGANPHLLSQNTGKRDQLFSQQGANRTTAG